MLSGNTVKLCLYIILAAVALYFIYTTFFADDSDDEDFANNSSVLDDAGHDKSFSKMSIREQVEYLQDKQQQIIDQSRAERS